ncbi:MAG: VWA domain-containing protein [Candidatus Nezhaarchaeota archaeon]|nr:VWA domain-containing protein [Candidatus Nezhaarchaeota archaeon]
MKPECRLCEDLPKTLSQLLGRENVESILYGLLNPSYAYLKDKERRPRFNLRQLLERFMDEADLDDYILRRGLYVKQYPRVICSWAYEEEVRVAKERAWRELMKMLERGEVGREDLSLQQLIEYFHEELLDMLEEEGYVKRERVSRGLSHYMHAILFTTKGEELIAERVLEEAFREMRVSSPGPHDAEEGGLGLTPSSTLTEFDEHKHTFDMLDIEETLINAAIKYPESLDLTSDVLKARIPYHRSRASNVILIDKSGSMSMSCRIVGAVEAALSLRKLLEEEYREDKLWVVAYDHNLYPLEPGEVANIWPYGWTDIGQALDYARQLLLGEDRNKNIFLITDGQPTTSSIPGQTPLQSALRASAMLREEGIRLNIIMLDSRSPSLRSLCEKMAELAGDANVVFVDNPLDLKSFVVKSYRDLRH